MHSSMLTKKQSRVSDKFLCIKRLNDCKAWQKYRTGCTYLSSTNNLENVQGNHSDTDQSLLPDHQLGLQKIRGTIEQVLRLTNQISHTLNIKIVNSALRAFDRVWHAKLLHKLSETLPAAALCQIIE